MNNRPSGLLQARRRERDPVGVDPADTVKGVSCWAVDAVRRKTRSKRMDAFCPVCEGSASVASDWSLIRASGCPCVDTRPLDAKSRDLGR